MNYLTSEQIIELKAKRAEWVNDSDLSDLKALLKDNGYKIDINMNTNHNNVFDIIYNKYQSDILQRAEWKEFKKNNPNADYGNIEGEKVTAIFKYLEVLNPKLNKIILNIDVIIKSKYFIHAISQIKEMTQSIKNFDTANFILNKDFDFAPYKVEANNSTLIENTIAIDKAVSKWFESFAKELNQEQKQIVSNNLLQTITFFVKNSSPAIVKEKGNEFQNLMEYTHSQSI